MKKIILVGICVLFLININACKKYSDGPRFSLRSKKSRVVNKWTIEKTEFYGSTTIGAGNNKKDFSLEFKEDGTMTRHYFDTEYDATSDDLGKWIFENKKEYLFIVYDNTYKSSLLPDAILTHSEEKWQIDRLTEKQLWISFVVGGSTARVYYKAL